MQDKSNLSFGTLVRAIPPGGMRCGDFYSSEALRSRDANIGASCCVLIVVTSYSKGCLCIKLSRTMAMTSQRALWCMHAHCTAAGVVLAVSPSDCRSLAFTRVQFLHSLRDCFLHTTVQSSSSAAYGWVICTKGRFVQKGACTPRRTYTIPSSTYADTVLRITSF